MNIVVIGMGYVGIPCAALLADVSGFSVTGVQRRSERSGWKIECLNNGRCPFEGDEPGLAELIHRVVVEKGTFRVTDDYAVCKDADVILIDVQTPTDGDHVPHYESLREVSAQLIPLAREINDGMPGHMAALIEEALAEAGRELAGTKVVLLGVAYLENADDARNTPAAALAKLLLARGAEVVGHDPYVREADWRRALGDGVDVPLTENLWEALRGADCVALVTRHREYQEMDLQRMKDMMRTVKRVQEFGFEGKLAAMPDLRVREPLGYLAFLNLMANARLVLTDSGGIQEETTILGVPCLTLRENTERPVTVMQGTNTVVGRDPGRIVTGALAILDGKGKAGQVPELWDGKAARRVVRVLFT